jgi:Kdo2-lipid IVA lauroyltransferase/acyltransferase
MLKKILKYPLYGLEAVGGWLIYLIFKGLSVTRASNLGGFLISRVGPLLSVSRVAYENLQRAFPEKPDSELKKILYRMWVGLGKNIGEYPHLAWMQHGKNFVVEGAEHLEYSRNRGALFFSAHLSHFQMIPVTAKAYGLPFIQLYRKASNPFIDYLMAYIQSDFTQGVIARGSLGDIRKIIRCLQEKKNLFVLMDQKSFDGVHVDFFGKKVRASDKIIGLSKRYNVPLIPCYVERFPQEAPPAPEHQKFFTNTSHCAFSSQEHSKTHAPLKGEPRFKIVFLPPLDSGQSPQKILQKIYDLFEQWIRKQPESWFWLHRRWSNALTQRPPRSE